MDWAIYGALSAGFLALSGGLAFLVVRSLQAWRALKRLRRHLAKELALLADLAEQTADKVGTASDTAELTTSVTRLRVTLRRLALLREAIDETTAAFARVTAVYPRK